MEGAVLLGEACAAGLAVESVFVESDAVDAVGDLDAIGARAAIRTVRPGGLEGVSSTASPQPVVAVVRVPTCRLDELGSPTLVVVAAGVADPGNLGTIVRSAEAAGADAVCTTPGSVDVWSPKVVRASAGAVFHLPVVEDVSVAEVGALGLTVLGAAATGGIDHDLVDLTRPVALVVGNEAHGLPPDVVLDGLVSIRHHGRAESLNVAMAATVLLFEAARQRHRRIGPPPGPLAN